MGRLWKIIIWGMAFFGSPGSTLELDTENKWFQNGCLLNPTMDPDKQYNAVVFFCVLQDENLPKNYEMAEHQSLSKLW